VQDGEIEKRNIDLLKIVESLEAAHFLDGYHKVISFEAGPCKPAWCPEVDCSAMHLGGICKHQGKIRPSMEGAGFDAMTMAARSGWDIYPIGSKTMPSDIPYGTRLGFFKTVSYMLWKLFNSRILVNPLLHTPLLQLF
jgi:hypothetical protein